MIHGTSTEAVRETARKLPGQGVSTPASVLGLALGGVSAVFTFVAASARFVALILLAAVLVVPLALGRSSRFTA